MKHRKNEARRVPTGKLIPCHGAAHSNPYIDNCLSCAPRWGEVEELAPLDVEAAKKARLDIPVNELSDEQFLAVQVDIDSKKASMLSVTHRNCSYYVIRYK